MQAQVCLSHLSASPAVVLTSPFPSVALTNLLTVSRDRSPSVALTNLLTVSRDRSPSVALTNLLTVSRDRSPSVALTNLLTVSRDRSPSVALTSLLTVIRDRSRLSTSLTSLLTVIRDRSRLNTSLTSLLTVIRDRCRVSTSLTHQRLPSLSAHLSVGQRHLKLVRQPSKRSYIHRDTGSKGSKEEGQNSNSGTSKMHILLGGEDGGERERHRETEENYQATSGKFYARNASSL